jgi:hypothetical protein
MKQTAVEWQFEQFFNSFEKFNNRECTFNDYLKRNLEIREQAKEMEKKEIIEAHFNGCEIGEMFNNENRAFITDSEQYYNKTFKQQEQ